MKRCLQRFLFVLNLLTLKLANAQSVSDATLLPTLSECGHLNWNEFIDRSGVVQPNEFPWLARIAYKDSKTAMNSVLCSAILISHRYLLTAAQCVEDSTHNEVSTVFLADSQVVPIEEIIIQPFFNKRKAQNNLALLRLNRTINYTSSVSPICLPAANIREKELGGEQLMLAGFYRDVESINIHKLAVSVSNTLDCRRQWKKLLEITDDHLCGISCTQGYGFVSSSPLMDLIDGDHYYLAGLSIARSRVCNYPERLDIFVRIDRYLDWIMDNLVD